MSPRSTKQSWGWLIGAASALPITCSEWAGVGSMAIALVLMVPAVAQAGQLSQWQYDEASHRLELTLSEETTPRYFLLAQPARIVVDLPNTQVGAVPLERSLSGPVRSLRISQFQPDVARVVIELSSDAVLGDGQVAIQRVNTSDLSIRPLFAGEAAPVAVVPPLPADPAPPEAPLPALPDSSIAVTPATPDLPEAETETLPPLEPGAIELAVTPPDAPVEEDPGALPALNVPSIATAIAELGLNELMNVNRVGNQAIAERSEASSGISFTEVTEAPPEHQFDPTAPVLDATVPTDRRPVLDATRPSSTLLARPQANITSPQDALAQVSSTAAEAAVGIPVEPVVGEAELPVPFMEAEAEDESELEAAPPARSTPSVPPTEPEIARSPALSLPPSSPSASTSQRPTIAFGQPIVEHREVTTTIPSGMTVSLRYPGEAPLTLNLGVRQEVLLLQQPLQDEQGNIIADVDSPVIGRFETSATGSKFVIQAIAAQAQNIRVVGESSLIEQPGTSAPAPSTAPEPTSSAFNPAALFSGVASSAATQGQPTQVVIQPDQIITVQITNNLASR